MQDDQRLIASLLDELACDEGLTTTAIKGVHLFRRSEPLARTAMIYPPHIIIVGQGQKRAYVGGQVYAYDAMNYLVSAVPMPAECEADASSERPVLGITIDVDAILLGEVIAELDEWQGAQSSTTPLGLFATPMCKPLSDAVVRLLGCLRDPVDCRILGSQTVREIIYRVLCGDQGATLRSLANRSDQFTRIARVLRFIHGNFAKPLSMEDLAKKAGMSVSVFHHQFKLVTACTPLQYLKQIRLDRARTLMAHDGHNSGSAARAVGYESQSQFSREFKRHFGQSPLEHKSNSKSV